MLLRRVFIALCLLSALLVSTQASSPAAASKQNDQLAVRATDADITETGYRSLEELQTQLANHYSGELTLDYGKMTPADQRMLGQTSYIEADQLVSYRLSDGSILTTLAGTTVYRDGEVRPPPETSLNGGFTGNWGSEYTHFTSVTDANPRVTKTACIGGACGTHVCEAGAVTGVNTTKFIWRKLSERNTTYDYYGVDVSGVAEITRNTGRWCDPYINRFGTGIRSYNCHRRCGSRTGNTYMENSPRVDQSGRCRSYTATVGGSFSGVSAGVERNIDICEFVDIRNGGATNSYNWYKAVYDDNGARPDAEREVGQVSVIRVRQGTGSGLRFWNMMDTRARAF